MQRVAHVYVNRRCGLMAGVKVLFDSNGVAYEEIDVTDDPATLDALRDRARSLELPIIELDGRFAAGVSVPTLARALGLEPPRRQPTAPGACC